MTSEESERLVRALYSSFNEKDFDRLDAVAIWGAAVDFLPFDVRVGLREAWMNWARAFPDGQVQIIQVDPHSDHAVIELVGRGTHAGPLVLPGTVIRPTHRRVQLHFIESYEMDEDAGKIAAGTSDFDAESLFAQLGVPMPPRRIHEEPTQAEFHWGY